MIANGFRFSGNEEKAERFVEVVTGGEFQFVCVSSYTKTCEIPGITVAGANTELLKYTPVADMEFLFDGKCQCIDAVPATPDGKPTPALITRAALLSADIPILAVSSANKIRPQLPHISLEAECGGNIVTGKAMNFESVQSLFRQGERLGEKLGRGVNQVVIGETIPGGTTTALGVLMAMGIDARFKVSSSMPANPHNLKVQTVEQGMKTARISLGELRSRPLEAIACMGDPMIPAAAGIALGASRTSKVLLAGGTQMAAVLSVMRAIDGNIVDNLALATTKYIIDDPTSDIKGLVQSIAEIPIFYCDPQLDRSSKLGLRAFANGFVKEGVGAGGACLAAILKTNGKVDGRTLLREIEKEYERAIECKSSS